MNRVELQQLAEARILDAAALLAGGRWALAYYTSGYAIECALKACVLARMGLTGWIFSEPKVKIDDVLTHNFVKLIEIAGLRSELNNRLAASAAAATPAAGAAPGAAASVAAPGAAFVGYWGVVSRWDVSTRYSTTTSEGDARDLHAAITDVNDGILPWLRNYW